MNKDWNKGFVDGFWYAVQQVAIYQVGGEESAHFLIHESGLSEDELRQSQKENGHENERMNKLLDEHFGNNKEV